MTQEQLQKAWAAIAWAAGWTRHPAERYSGRRFADDLNAIHPGIITYWQLYRLLAPPRKGHVQRPIPLALDPVVEELLGRATAGHVDPPQQGPYHRAAASQLPARSTQAQAGVLCKQWRDARRWSFADVERASQDTLKADRIRRLESGAAVATPADLELLASTFGVTLRRFLDGPGPELDTG